MHCTSTLKERILYIVCVGIYINMSNHSMVRPIIINIIVLLLLLLQMDVDVLAASIVTHMYTD